MNGETWRSETLPTIAHRKSMGRDEMNLAEFPLASLAARPPRGCKTLVFEDTIWDRGQSQPHLRRLTISASDKYGLPAAADDEVILGLVQLTKAAGFAERRVNFSRYQLIRLLGWRDEGRSYARLEKSLKRWLGVTLYYESAWWDKAQKRWVDAHFHLLDDLVLYRRQRSGGSSRGTTDRTASSIFTWNEIVFRSFRAGFLKQLDLDFYRRLKLATTKRMYRFLDKRFHFSSHLRFTLTAFACEHIGLSRGYDAGQLKRRLNPAIEELEQADYLVRMPVEERYCRLRRGVWEIILVRTPKRRKRSRAAVPSGLEGQLVERGVSASSATRLVREYSGGLVREKIEVHDQLRRAGDRRVSKNPAGYLVQSIRNNYVPPPGMETTCRRPVSEGGCSAARPPGRAIRPKRSGVPEHGTLAEKVHEYVSALDPDERARLEEDAVAAAQGLAAEGLRRSLEAGKVELADHYRQAILNHHVLALLKPVDAAS